MNLEEDIINEFDVSDISYDEAMLVLRAYVVFYGDIPNFDKCNDEYEMMKIQFIEDLLIKYNAFSGINKNYFLTREVWDFWKTFVLGNELSAYVYMEKMVLPKNYDDKIMYYSSYLIRRQIEKKITRDVKPFEKMKAKDYLALNENEYIKQYFMLIKRVFDLRDNISVARICLASSKDSKEKYISNLLFARFICKFNFFYTRKDVEEIEEFFEKMLGLVQFSSVVEMEKGDLLYRERLNCLEDSALKEGCSFCQDFNGITFDARELLGELGTISDNIVSCVGYNRLVKKK